MFEEVILIPMLSGVAVFLVVWQAYRSGGTIYEKGRVVRRPKAKNRSGYRLVAPFCRAMGNTLFPLVSWIFPQKLSRNPMQEQGRRGWLYDWLERSLIIAGRRETMQPEEIPGASFLCGLLGAALGFWLQLFWPNPLVGPGGTLLGMAIPFLWLKDTGQKRRKQILREMPFVLDLLDLKVMAGKEFPNAVREIAGDLRPGPLREELEGLGRQLAAGKSLENALQTLSRRLMLEEISSLCIALIHSEKTGVNLSRTLQIQAKNFRQYRFRRAEELAAKAPVKMVFPLVLFLAPTTIVLVIAPLLLRFRM